MWVQWVQKFREVAARRGMKVAITPRATQRGAVMLAHGIDLGNVARLEIGNRMSAQDWQNLQNDAGINAPLPIVGKHKYLQHKHTDLLLALVRARVHVWLAGPAGSGKSKVAEIVSQKLALPFYCTGAVASEYKLSGFVDAQGRAVITQFRKAFSEGGVFLFDEIDRSLPNAVLPFNGWLANLKADMPGNDGLVDAHADFVALVGANTNGQGATAEYSGAMKQDAAFLDRFAILTWDYDTELEAEVAHLAARNAVKARNARKGA
jgi:MoxR-like ATPase